MPPSSSVAAMPWPVLCGAATLARREGLPKHPSWLKVTPPLVLVLSRGLQCGGPLNQKKSRTFINSRKQPKSAPEDLSEPKLSWDVFFCLFALKGSDGPLWLDQDKASRYSGVTNESGATRVVNLECFFLLMTTKWVFGILLVVLEGT